MGRNARIENIDDLAEDTLSALGEQRVFSKQRAEVLKLVTGLQDAGCLDLELAENRVRRAELELRESREALARARETNGHEKEALSRLAEISTDEDRALDEDVRQVSLDVKTLGASYTRDDLIANGAAGVLERKRRRVREAGAAPIEEQVV